MRRAILALSLAAALAVVHAGAARADPLAAPVEGPARLCFLYSSFQLAAGERVTDFAGGIHAMSITVDGPHGRYTVSEGDAFATPRLGRTVHQAETLSVRRDRRNSRVRYAVFGLTDYSPDQPRLLIWLSGPALAGARSEAVFRRITIGDPTRAKCDHGFAYGWDFVLGEDPKR